MKPLFPALALAAAFATPAAAQSSRADALAQLKAEFLAGDVNHDGVLTRSEVAARINRMQIAGKGRLSPAQAKRLTALWFARTDANGDGKVTFAEASAELTALFDRYDTNHDGVISAAERQAAHAALRPPAKRGEGR